MYTINYRRELNLLDITWSGLFTPEDMAQYADDCRECLRLERFQEGYRLRVVLTDGKPLPQHTLAVLADAFVGFPQSSRTAVVTTGAVARMQIMRAMLVPGMRLFDTPDAALEWLMSP